LEVEVEAELDMATKVAVEAEPAELYSRKIKLYQY
jgi:hypothetical protein